MKEIVPSKADFAETYERLSETGLCDKFGGMESRRVYAEWVAAGRPLDIAEFIRQRANVLHENINAPLSNEPN